MNIHEAVDRLEYLIAHSRQIPLTRTVVIDQEEALACIDDLRLSLPDEIKQARWTLQEQQRLLSEAQSEAARTRNRFHSGSGCARSTTPFFATCQHTNVLARSSRTRSSSSPTR